MYLEFTPNWEFGYLEEFARKLNVVIEDNILYLPIELGNGFVKKVDIDNDLRIIIHSYRFKESLSLKDNKNQSP